MNDLFDIQTDTWLRATKMPDTKSRVRVVVAVGIAVVLGAILFWLGQRVGARPVPSLEATAERLQQQVAVLQPRTVCSPYSRDITNIGRLINRGHYQAAADLANLDLQNSNKPACPDSGLSRVWYTASMNGLFSTPPAAPDDLQPVLQWDGIEKRADQLGLGVDGRISPLTVAVFAYDNHEWELCRAALVKALRDGLFVGTDRVQVSLYQAATRNEGHEIAFHSAGSRRSKGEGLLALASAIGRYVHHGEAAADLEKLVGKHWTAKVAQPGANPVLQALRHGR